MEQNSLQLNINASVSEDKPEKKPRSKKDNLDKKDIDKQYTEHRIMGGYILVL